MGFFVISKVPASISEVGEKGGEEFLFGLGLQLVDSEGSLEAVFGLFEVARLATSGSELEE